MFNIQKHNGRVFVGLCGVKTERLLVRKRRAGIRNLVVDVHVLAALWPLEFIPTSPSHQAQHLPRTPPPALSTTGASS